MTAKLFPKNRSVRVLVLGVGSFSQSVLHFLKNDGAEVHTYLTRDYAHYPPSTQGPTYLQELHPNPCHLAKQLGIDFIVPMSIDWHDADWAEEIIASGIPILSPFGAGMRLERERDFGRHLCLKYGIPWPASFVAQNKLEAQKILDKHPNAYVIKNPFCSPTSPIHTIVCETISDTRSWLERIDYAEGVYLQEYLGRREAGHIAFVSAGEIYPLITNQEYKHAFNGNMGIIAGAPLGGLVQLDTEDEFGLAKELLFPLLPWFRETGYHGPVQVTACKKQDRWHVIEYNVRLGVTCAPMILGLLANPLEVLWNVVHNQKLQFQFNQDRHFSCSLTLAGFGYPYTQITGPNLPVTCTEPVKCDLWWNEVDSTSRNELFMTGHRIAEIVAFAPKMEDAIALAYKNIKKLHCVGSYYRTDIGESKWPPGTS
ncbi:MAG: phosphoribosylamine--glycine ligase [Calditrichaeota bacterium]|nr:MAG: phosphoribosylamine--glycine ligase [Calditrichota bacterium]